MPAESVIKCSAITGDYAVKIVLPTSEHGIFPDHEERWPYSQLIPDCAGVRTMSSLFSRPTADECSPYYFTYIQLVPDGDIVHTLQTQHADIHAILKRTTDANASSFPAAGEWSIKQVIAHLSDTER